MQDKVVFFSLIIFLKKLLSKFKKGLIQKKPLNSFKVVINKAGQVSYSEFMQALLS